MWCPISSERGNEVFGEMVKAQPLEKDQQNFVFFFKQIAVINRLNDLFSHSYRLWSLIWLKTSPLYLMSHKIIHFDDKSLKNPIQFILLCNLMLYDIVYELTIYKQ